MASVFRLRDCDADLLTRAQGERIRARLAELHEQLPPGGLLEIDLAGVGTMTPSFADECFGKLAERVGQQSFRSSISLKGADETIRVLINSVLARRLAPARVPMGGSHEDAPSRG